MKPDEFCRWLQGFAELNEAVPSEAQWKSIREHLQTVFAKVTPPIGASGNKQIEDMLRGMDSITDHVRIC